MKLPWFVAPFILFSAGFALLLCAIIVPFQIEEQVDNKLVRQFLFEDNTTDAYARWQSNLLPDSALGWVQIYMYNTTNAWDVICCDAKPILQEIGPFYYRQYLQNVNATFSQWKGETVITTNPWIYLIFDQEKTAPGLNENLIMTMPGLGYWGILGSYMVRHDPALLGLLRSVYGGFTPYLNLTVHQWLYGYQDPVLSLVKMFRPDIVKNDVVALFRNQTSPDAGNTIISTTTESTAANKTTASSPTPTSTTIVTSTITTTTIVASTSTVSCGFPNAARFQQTLFWQGLENVTYWDPPLPVQGSPGNYFGFRREGQEDDEVHFWSLVARHVRLNHTSTGSYKGIKVYRYHVDPKEYYNATLNPTNARFQQLKYNGFFNLTIQFLAGVFYSRGHWLGVDPQLANQVIGVPPPNATQDEIYFDIEPLTGAVIRQFKPVQENLLFGDWVAPELGVNVSRLFLHPLILMQINTLVSDQQAQDLYDALAFYEDALLTQNLILYGGALIGSCLILFAAWLTHHRRENQKEHEPLTEDTHYGT